MRYIDARILENRSLGAGYFVLRLGECPALANSKPGQFVMLRGDWGRDPLLPRPISLLSATPDGCAEVLAKTVGQGTKLLESAQPDARIAVLGPLGSAFPDPSSAVIDLLVAGGVGMPPLFMHSSHAAKSDLVQHCEMLYGGRTSPDILLLPEMQKIGLATHIATEDGSLGLRGRVTEILEARIKHHQATGARPLRVLACGPKAMLWATARIAERYQIECYLSLEEQMACGFGVCLGCAVPAKSRPFRYGCKDGPVFLSSDLVIPPAPQPEDRHA